MVSGVFIDTKFYLFSRRNPSGKVCRPLPLYANSVILDSVPYFKDRGYPISRCHSLTCRNPYLVLSGEFAEGVAKSLDHYPFEKSDQEEDCDYLSDSDLEEDVEVLEPTAKTYRAAVENQDSGVATIDGSRNELDHQGKVVVLRSVPYLTSVKVLFYLLHLPLTEPFDRFRAVVMYLYTGEIDFAPFGSKENRELRAPELLPKEEGTIPRPSPKSIYRIADMVRVRDGRRDDYELTKFVQTVRYARTQGTSVWGYQERYEIMRCYRGNVFEVYLSVSLWHVCNRKSLMYQPLIQVPGDD